MAIVDYNNPKDLPAKDYNPADVPKYVADRSEGVREAKYGAQNKEFIAQAMDKTAIWSQEAKQVAEDTSARQDALEQYNDAMMVEMTDKDVISAPEIIAARGGKPTLQARLDDTTAQLAQIESLKEYSVKSFGILPSEDITVKINEAIDAIAELGGGKLIFPDNETYLVDGSVGVVLQSNVSLDFSSGAKLKVIPNALERYSCIVVRNVRNIEIINPHLIGDNADHFGVGGEWGFGLDIRNAQDVSIYTATATDFWGDGIYLGDENHDEQNNNVNFYGKTTVKRCRRQGVSVIAGNNCHIEYLDVEDIIGTQPEAGIDFEPNFSHQTITNFTMGKLRAVRCEEPALFVSQGNIFDIAIENIEAVECRNTYLEFVALKHSSVDSGSIKIGSVHFDRLVSNPIITAKDWHVFGSPEVSINSIVIDYWDNSSTAFNSIYSALRMELHRDSPAGLGNYGGFSIGNILVKDGIMSKPFSSVYVNRLLPTIVIAPTTKLSNISLAVNPSSKIPSGGVFGHILPVDYNSVKISSEHSLNALRGGDNTNLNTLLNRVEYLNTMTMINYDSGRPGITNYPPGYGFILSFSGASASFDIAFSSLDAKVYVRRLDANNSGSTWKELSQV